LSSIYPRKLGENTYNKLAPQIFATGVFPASSGGRATAFRVWYCQDSAGEDNSFSREIRASVRSAGQDASQLEQDPDVLDTLGSLPGWGASAHSAGRRKH